MSFEASEPASANHLDPAGIGEKTFSTAWKGYRVEEVRAYLAQVASSTRELVLELDSTRSKVADHAANGGRGSEEPSPGVLKAEETAAQILHDANEAAKALRDQARSILETTRVRAEEESRQIISDARMRSESLLGQGSDVFTATQHEELARRELDQARQKAAEIIEQAKAEGRAMIDQARDLRNEILADLRQKRSFLDNEIADLATRRIEAHQSLARAVQLISEAGTIIAPSAREDPNGYGIDEVGLGAYPTSGPVDDGAGDDGGNTVEPGVSELGNVRSSLSDAEAYQAKLVNSQVEIGSHLEEGIVRVFSKVSESHIELDDAVLPEEPYQPSESDALLGDEDVNLADRSIDSRQSEAEQVSAANQTVSHAQVDGVEDKLGDLGREASNVEGQVESTLDESEVLPYSTSTRVEPDLAQSLGHISSPEKRASSTADEEAGRRKTEGLHETERPSIAIQVRSHSQEMQMSRRADEILARIRSLRMGGEELSETVSSGSADVSVIAVENPRSAAVPYSREVKSLRVLSQSAAEELDLNIASEHFEESETGQRLYETESLATEVDAATRELLDVREELLAPTATMLFKKVKRLLADEQNDLLDKVRRSSGSEVVLNMLLDEKEQIDALAIASLDFFEQVRLGVAELFAETSGSAVRREISKQAVEYSEEFAKEVVLPLRRRIDEALAVDNTVEDQSTAAALGAIYRDVRSNWLEPLISQYANTVFCATVMLESGYESFIWAVDPQDVPCADCLDNSLAGATIRGEQFPTGHLHPGIHSGCRCLLVPFIA
ncbi:MAG: DivIVA domain-containing protein [Actinomycetota bacterium]|nr:DivIVA domain-containing protein [Actinomycetota bacterium]